MYVGERAPDIVAIGRRLLQVVIAEISPAALYLFVSVARASHAVAIVRMSAIVLFCFARCIAVRRFGIAIAARMPMIATTISSSMRVKPFCFLVIEFLLDEPSRAQPVYQRPQFFEPLKTLHLRDCATHLKSTELTVFEEARDTSCHVPNAYSATTWRRNSTPWLK